MQIQFYLIAALAFVVTLAGSNAVTYFWTAHAKYEAGQRDCRAEVVDAAQGFLKRRKVALSRINERSMTAAVNAADRAEARNDSYEDALDVIRTYEVQLGTCNVPDAVRRAIGKIK